MQLRHCKRNLYIKILTKVYVCSCINYMLITEEFGIGLYLHFYYGLHPSRPKSELGYIFFDKYVSRSNVLFKKRSTIISHTAVRLRRHTHRNQISSWCEMDKSM